MITIRQVLPEEWELIVELNKRIYINNSQFDEDLIIDFTDTEVGQRFFKESVEDPESIYFVAEEHEEWLGYVSGSPKTIPYRKSRYFEIENLGVTPEAKGKGIGKLLLEAITNSAKNKGFQKIYIECYAKNEEALAFYRKNGYEEIDISLEKKI